MGIFKHSTYATFYRDNRWKIKIDHVDGYVFDMTWHANGWTVFFAENDCWLARTDSDEKQSLGTDCPAEAVKIASELIF